MKLKEGSSLHFILKKKLYKDNYSEEKLKMC